MVPGHPELRIRAGLVLAVGMVIAILPASSSGAVSGTDTITTIAGNGEPSEGPGPAEGPATGSASSPRYVATAPPGTVHAGSVFNTQHGVVGVWQVTPEGQGIRFAGGGTTEAPGGPARDFAFPGAARLTGVDVAPDGQVYVVTDLGGLYRIDTAGNIHLIVTDAERLYGARGIEVDSAGTTFIARGGSRGYSVEKVSASGVVTNVLGDGVGGCGPVYDKPIEEGGVIINGRVSYPWDVALNADESMVYVADLTQHAIWTVPVDNPAGFSLHRGKPCYGSSDPTVSFPTSVAVDDENGELFWTSSGSSVRTAAGVIAGTETMGYNGDGIAANAAQIKQPNSIDVINGRLYIGDTGNNRLRMVAPPTCPGYATDPRNQIVGTENKDVLPGTPGPDIMCGLGANDTLRGLGDNDILIGGEGNDIIEGGNGVDTITGEGGDDSINGGPSADTLDGGAGYDTTSYAGSGAGVTVDLRLPQSASGGWAAGDSLVLFERATGSASADSLTGSGLNNILRGNGGDDDLIGLGGHDTLQGGNGGDEMTPGNGNDTLDYSDSLDVGGDLDGVTVNIATNVVSGDFAFGDTIVGAGGTAAGFEYVEGTKFNDIIDGNDLINRLFGYGGVDVLHGFGANDALYGGIGDDDLFGDLGDDKLFGEGGSDDLDGGDGTDSCNEGASPGGALVSCET